MNITSGTLSCDVEVRGERVNRIAGNYIIPRECTFSFSPTTIVQDNFTDVGPWEEEKNVNRKEWNREP